MGKRLTPREGFIGGMICGAVFALVESLGMMSSAPAEGWALSAVGRMGTAILHITTTSLTGWGLATAWQDRHFGKLGAACLISVFFHGVWNTFGLLAGWGALVPAGSFGLRLAGIAPVVLAFLAIVLYCLLMIGNRLLVQPAEQISDRHNRSEEISKG